MHTRFDEVFHISIIIKGLDGLAEIIGGVFLLFVTPHDIQRFVQWLARQEISRDPHDFIGTIIRHTLHHTTVTSTLFGAVYLLSHGIVKLVVIVLVLKNKLWAYPLLIAMLLGFMAYQIVEIVNTHSIAYTLLTIFDVFVLVMTWIEWLKQLELHHLEQKQNDQA